VRTTAAGDTKEESSKHVNLFNNFITMGLKLLKGKLITCNRSSKIIKMKRRRREKKDFEIL
jgi:hypothetical protein